MPVVVEAPDDDPMRIGQLPLGLIDWIILQPVCCVLVRVERRLVSNDQVGAQFGGPGNHGARRQEGRDNACEWLPWIAYLNGIGRVGQGFYRCRGEYRIDGVLNGDWGCQKRALLGSCYPV